MSRRMMAHFLVICFALAVAHHLWRFVIRAPDSYSLSGFYQVLRTPDPSAKQLYLRRILTLPNMPDHAWLQVLSQDEVSLLVNGKLVQKESNPGFPAAILADITPHLTKGKNVLAIIVRQSTRGIPPQVAVTGRCHLGSFVMPIDSAATWKTNSVFAKDAYWWFEREFDDSGWERAVHQQRWMSGNVDTPIDLVTSPVQGDWILAPTSAPQALFVSQFSTVLPPKSAWLKITAGCEYRLAVNGEIVDHQLPRLNSAKETKYNQRGYNLTPLCRTGQNDIRIWVSDRSEPLAIRVEGGVVDLVGNSISIRSRKGWKVGEGTEVDWQSTELSSDLSPCLVLGQSRGIPPRNVERTQIPVSSSVVTVTEQIIWFLLLFALVGISTEIGCGFLTRWCSEDLNVYLGLLPSIVLAGGFWLASFDPRLSYHWVYSVPTSFILVALVPFFWLLQVLANRWILNQPWQQLKPERFSWELNLVGVVTLGGFVLRLVHLPLEPLHWDEADHYHITLGFFKNGFPSHLAPSSLNLPDKLIDTSEFFYFFTALATFLFDDPKWIVRFPGLCWGTATVALLYLVARQMDTRRTAIIAAVLYACAPTCIGMSCFGRYFSQLQFFALLTTYLLWRTIREEDINRHYLVATTLSFLAMFFTWEGSALLAPAMAFATLIHRRNRLRSLLLNPTVWGCIICVLVLVVVQQSHRHLQQTQFIRFGTSLSSLRLQSMLDSPLFEPSYFLLQASWIDDAFLPMCGLVLALLIALSRKFTHPCGFLLIIFVGTALTMSLSLPLAAPRYAYYLSPFLILLSAASASFLVDQVTQPKPFLENSVLRLRVWVPCGAATCGLVLIASGWTIQPQKLNLFGAGGYRPDVMKFPNFEGSCRFVGERICPTDALLLSHPPLGHELLKGLNRDGIYDYTLLSTLHRSVTLPDDKATPVHPYDGTQVLSTLEELKLLFQTHDRVWYILNPASHGRQNNDSVSAFLIQYMDVVYEDHETVVLLRENYRSASIRMRLQQALANSGIELIP